MFETVYSDIAQLAEDELEPERSQSEARRLVTFELGNELYAAPILEISEIRDVLPWTPFPPGRTPAHNLGLINLRGTTLPVLDLRALFDLQPGPASGGQLLIAKGPGYLTAVLVDRVRGLARLDKELFKPAPASLSQSGAAFCEQVAFINGRLLMEVSLSKILMATAASDRKG